MKAVELGKISAWHSRNCANLCATIVLTSPTCVAMPGSPWPLFCCIPFSALSRIGRRIPSLFNFWPILTNSHGCARNYVLHVMYSACHVAYISFPKSLNVTIFRHLLLESIHMYHSLFHFQFQHCAEFFKLLFYLVIICVITNATGIDVKVC